MQGHHGDAHHRNSQCPPSAVSPAARGVQARDRQANGRLLAHPTWARDSAHLRRPTNNSDSSQCVVCRTDSRVLILYFGGSEVEEIAMSPNQVIALGPELLPWAREHTNDLNEAHFLVHQVVSRLAGHIGVDDEQVAVDRAQLLMSEVARQNGVMGQVTS